MKIVCLVFSLMMDGSVQTQERPLQSIEECRAYVHQQEFHYAVAPVYGSLYTCLAFWEA